MCRALYCNLVQIHIVLDSVDGNPELCLAWFQTSTCMKYDKFYQEIFKHIFNIIICIHKSYSCNKNKKIIFKIIILIVHKYAKINFIF